MSKKLNRLMAEAWNLSVEIEKMEEDINRKRARLALLKTVDIPEEMTEAGSSSFAADDGSGLSCVVAFKVYGSLPSRDNPEARFAAIEYLKSLDAEDLIVSRVQIDFSKGDDRGAARTKRFIDEQIKKKVIRASDSNRGPILAPMTKIDSDVHHSTLAAWARQRIKENQPLNLDIVGLRGGVMAEIKKKEVA